MGNIIKHLQCIVNVAELRVKVETAIAQVCVGVKTQFEEVGMHDFDTVKGFLR